MGIPAITTLPEVHAFIKLHQQHFIQGGWHASSHAERLAIYNPATGETLTSVAAGTAADIDQAVQAAHIAFQDKRWSNLHPTERKRILFRFFELVQEHGEILAQLETLNQGQSIHLARHRSGRNG